MKPSTRRCIFGCGNVQTLFSFPPESSPWLRRQWLEFCHFEEAAIHSNSKICDQHFPRDDFQNYGQFSAGFASHLLLSGNSIPSLYTVGIEAPPKPTTRDVACQYVVHTRTAKNQVGLSQFIRRRSQGIQVQPKMCTSSTWMPDNCGIDQPLPTASTDPSPNSTDPSSPNSTDPSPSSTATSTPMSTPTSKRPRIETVATYVPDDTVLDVPGSDSEGIGSVDTDTTGTQTQLDATLVPDDCVSQEVPGPQDIGSTSPFTARKYIVFEDNLFLLLNKCRKCKHACTLEKQVIGTFLSVTQICLHCDRQDKWQSQPYIGALPAGNILLSAAVAFNGASFTQVHKVLSSLRLQSICPRTHYRHQHAYLQPTILHQWKLEQAKVLDVAKAAGKPITLGGDMRADSPGHSAKYGSYTMLDLDHNRIVDLQLVQSNEPGVRFSNNMELAGFTRSLSFLESAGLTIGAIVTDRHLQVQKYMKEQKKDIQHYYDAWHVAKGLSKKIEALGKERGCEVVKGWRKSSINHVYWSVSSSHSGEEAVAKWTSIVNHVQNVHEHSNQLFPKCAHNLLADRAWLSPNTKACERFCDLMLKAPLLKDIAKIHPREQTSAVESFHSLILRYAPKNVVFPYIGMLCRLLLACLHYNENAARERLLLPDGRPKTRVRFPKYKKGEYSRSFVKGKPTYNFVDTLQQLLEEVLDNPRPFQAKIEAIEVPPALSAEYERPGSNEDLSRWSRFAAEP